MTLGERVGEIRLILQRPFHLFTYLPKEKTMMLILEGDNIKTIPRMIFSGEDMIGAIEDAETYITHEKNMGSLIDINKQE